jgi:hypothetical protein
LIPGSITISFFGIQFSKGEGGGRGPGRGQGEAASIREAGRRKKRAVSKFLGVTRTNVRPKDIIAATTGPVRSVVRSPGAVGAQKVARVWTRGLLEISAVFVMTKRVVRDA